MYDDTRNNNCIYRIRDHADFNSIKESGNNETNEIFRNMAEHIQLLNPDHSNLFNIVRMEKTNKIKDTSFFYECQMYFNKGCVRKFAYRNIHQYEGEASFIIPYGIFMGHVIIIDKWIIAECTVTHESCDLDLANRIYPGGCTPKYSPTKNRTILFCPFNNNNIYIDSDTITNTYDGIQFGGTTPRYGRTKQKFNYLIKDNQYNSIFVWFIMNNIDDISNNDVIKNHIMPIIIKLTHKVY